MVQFEGKSVYKGIVLGKVVVLKNHDDQVRRRKITDADAEIAAVESALEEAKGQLQKLYDKALKEVGESNAAIFEVHQMMLEDEDYIESIQSMIRTEMVNASYAVAVTGDNFSEMFASMDDDYMKARAADVKDISNRLVRILEGEGESSLSEMEPSIIIADDLSPSETVQMDKEKILAFGSRLDQFPHGDPCAHDEHSGAHRRSDGLRADTQRNDGRGGRLCRPGDVRAGRGALRGDAKADR